MSKRREGDLAPHTYLREGNDLLEPAPQRFGSAGRDHTFGHGLGDHKAMRDFINRLKKDHGKGWTEGWKNPARFVDQKGCHPLTEYERNSPGEALPFRLQGQEPRLH
jgi:hypothetical protein